MRLLAVLSCAASLVAGCGPGNESTDGDCKDPLIAGDLVITEVFADYKGMPGGSGADTGKEWFEIYNTTGRTIDLAGLTIAHSRPDGTKAASHVVTKASIAAGQYFTLGNAAQEFVPAYVDYGYGADLGDMFNSDGGKLKLSCGTSEIDSAVYDDITEGHARQLSVAPEYTANDGQDNWCEASAAEFEAGNFGTPGAASDCAAVATGKCNDGGTMRAPFPPGPGDLVITEVMPSPAKASDDTAEWFEAKVIADVDLNGVGLDRVGETTKPDVISSPDCIRARAGSYLVFAKSTDAGANGGLPMAAIAGLFKFSMVGGSAASPGDVSILAGDTVVDAVTWTKSSNGKSLQLDPTHTAPAENDVEANFCDATLAYGLGDLGTPGMANPTCGTVIVPPTGDQCDDNGTMRAIVKPTAGQLVITEFMPDPQVVLDTAGEWFEVMNTGTTAFDLNGLSVSASDAPGTPIASASCIKIAAQGFGLFAHSTAAADNGSLPAVSATFAFSLKQTAGQITVLDGTTPLDVVTWASVTAGASKQLDITHLNVTDNDVATNFCNGTAVYNTSADNTKTDKGTPGVANVACP